MIHQLFSQLARLVFGSNRLLPYEEICINAWRSQLPEVLREKLDNQLANFDLIQRQARATKSVFYSRRDPEYKNWSDDVLFPDRDEDKKVFTGKLIGKLDDVTETVKFSIFLHRGRLSSIEFSSEPGAMTSMISGLTVTPG